MKELTSQQQALLLFKSFGKNFMANLLAIEIHSPTTLSEHTND
jgi:hypothetical protein